MLPSTAFLPGLVFAACLALPAQAAITQTLSYGGYLTDAATGLPLGGGKDMDFRLFTQAAGGASVWNEQRCGASGVPVSNGRYQVEIGSQTAGGIPASVVSDRSALWLEVAVDPNDDCAGFEALSPRVRLEAAAYTFSALVASTAAYAAITGDMAVSADTDADGNGDVVLKTGAAERLRVQSAGRVGLGTATPVARLHVSSAGAVSTDEVLRVSSGTGTMQELVRVWGDGRVAVGTTSPSGVLLEVNGKTAVNSTLTVSGAVTANLFDSYRGEYIEIYLSQCGGPCGGNHALSTWTDIAAQGYSWTLGSNTAPDTFSHNGTGRITVNKAGTYLIRLHAMLIPVADANYAAYFCPSINGSADCSPNQSACGIRLGYYPAGWWTQYNGPFDFIRTLPAGTTIGYAYDPVQTLTYWAHDTYMALDVVRVN
ncbi:MAG: hypothetical protein WC969_14380 [Elusimicrobiota bacterium]|jgi:hypothetical protein